MKHEKANASQIVTLHIETLRIISGIEGERYQQNLRRTFTLQATIRHKSKLSSNLETFWDPSEEYRKINKLGHLTAIHPYEL